MFNDYEPHRYIRNISDISWTDDIDWKHHNFLLLAVELILYIREVSYNQSQNCLVIPLKPDEIIDSEIIQALKALKIINEKRNGVIKGGTCANGSKQKMYFKEVESVVSPMVFLEGSFATLVIDAHKEI